MVREIPTIVIIASMNMMIWVIAMRTIPNCDEDVEDTEEDDKNEEKRSLPQYPPLSSPSFCWLILCREAEVNQTRVR